jgi:eukaryotic-like serine/threonine-protein kinase
MPQPGPAPGTMVTFYSYKGGTGRSMVLANIAFLAGRYFATANEKILVIDWDLEAPGLHRYFSDKCDSSQYADRPGVIDYFVTIQRKLDTKLYDRLSSAEASKVLQQIAPLEDYVIPDVAQGVDLIKAGRFGAGYTEAVASFDWAEFYRRYHRVYRTFIEHLTSRYSMCFVDSRTGLSDISGVCTMLMPEKLVAVFTPNRQSLEGVIEVVSKAIEYRSKSDDPRPLSVFPLPSRIVTDEHRLLQAATDKYKQVLKNVFMTVMRCRIRAI